MAESEDMVEVEPTAMEELGVSRDELKKMLEEVIQCVEEMRQQRTYMIELQENAIKAIKKYKVFLIDLFANSEEEVIEIPNEDDNTVICLDSADISRMAKEQPLIHEVFLDFRKLAQDIQNFMDVVKTKLGSLATLGASAAMAESKDRMKQEMEETAIALDELKQMIDKELEELKYIWRHHFGNATKFHF